mmetsp:Transcript_2641/g.5719  ORF Transcript_2641/g.5719 Transcript_2641/m.5719 type:complete len:92 (+) Transcript_2641:725-1000(+)
MINSVGNAGSKSSFSNNNVGESRKSWPIKWYVEDDKDCDCAGLSQKLPRPTAELGLVVHSYPISVLTINGQYDFKRLDFRIKEAFSLMTLA